MTGLEITLLYLLAAVLGVVTCRYFQLPPMLGYLAVGVAIGPNALALSQNADGVRYLGEFGVVFLMFVIGLEFNLPKLRAMRQHMGIRTRSAVQRPFQPGIADINCQECHGADYGCCVKVCSYGQSSMRHAADRVFKPLPSNMHAARQPSCCPP